MHNMQHVSELTNDIVASFGKQRAGIPLGIHKVDEYLNGLEPGDFCIVAGRPSMGKSAYAGTMSLSASMQHTTLFLSLEMNKQRLIERMLSSVARVNCRDMVKGRLCESDVKKVLEAQQMLNNRKLIIDDQSYLTPSLLRKKISLVDDIKMVIIDYLQLMYADRRDTREQEVSEISREMKLIANDFNIPVVALAQLNRQCESRDDSMPRASDLRESGTLEQNADKILLLHRSSYYDMQASHTSEDDNGEAKIIIGKNRNGPCEVVDCTFMSEMVGFYDIETEEMF